MQTEKWICRVSIVLALLGLIDALYLFYFKINPVSTMCVGVGGCDAVNASSYSEIYGIPISIFGGLAYLTIMLLLLLEERHPLLREWGPLAVFGLTLIGTLFSAYLTHIEVAVLFKICPYCVVSAVIMTLLCIGSATRLRRYL